VPLHVALVSPERVLYEGEAQMVVCRPADGEIAFLPGHVPFVGALGPYPVRVIRDGAPDVIAAVHAGFVEMRDDRVTVLSDVAELPDQIDVLRAETAKEAAERTLAGDPDNPVVAAALARANLRLEVARATTKA